MRHKGHHFVYIIINIFVAVIAETKPTFNRGITMKEVLLECREETGATESDFDVIFQKKETPTTMASKCLRACLMKKFNLMDENGKFNKDVALQITTDHIAGNSDKMRIATEIVNICYTLEVSENHCEAAEQYGKCANEHVRARGLSDHIYE